MCLPLTDKSVLITVGLLASAITAAVFIFVPAIPQDPSYHGFADQRTIFAIPHFFNVITNLPLLIVGLRGIRLVADNRFPGGLPELRRAYITFFSGIFLVGLGSSYYHLNPVNKTLVWDRLPMSIAFMAFFSIIIGEHITVKTANQLLYPLVIAGLLSIVFWYWGEQRGQGDLRFYGLVQFMPMLLIPVILITGTSRFASNVYLWAFLGAYAAAKLAEYGDNTIYRLSGVISGHSIKHLLAAAGVWFFVLGLKQRVRIS